MVDVAGQDRRERQVPRGRHRLATALDSFVGRESDVARLHEELRTHSLVSVTGPGGVGKTRTALTAAELWDDDVYVVELASVTDPSQIAPTVATAIGVSDQSNRDAVDRVIGHLAAAPSLLVVDNCEHLVEGTVRLLLRLLADLPELTVLATSRSALGVRGEQVHRLDPLAVPETGRCDGRSLTEVPSVRLLLDRARGLLPEFRIDDGNRGAVVALCRKLDGLPLAIELAAVRLRSLSVSQVVDRLDGRLHLLAAPGPGTEPRQQSLRALIDWSYDLCSPAEQLLWARMSVFPASAGLETLEGVCGHGDLAGDRLLDALDGLIGKSVVVVDRDGEDLRYRQFVSLREYGAEQLDESGCTEEIRRLHRDHYIAVATTVLERWCGPDQARDLARLRLDHPNLLAALGFSASTPGEEVAGARLASLLRYHWIAGGFLTYGRRWLERLLRRLDPRTPERGEALWVVAWVALIQGDRSVAREYLDECTAIAEELGDVAMQGHAAHWTALMNLFEGDLVESVDRYRHAMEMHREVGDAPAELTAGFQLGMAETYGERPQQALSTVAAVIERATADGEMWNHGYARWVEAITRLHLGELQAARDAVLSTLLIERDFRDGVCTALSVEVCSWIMTATGRAADGATLSGVAAGVWRRLGTSLAAFGPHASAEGRAYDEQIDRVLGADAADALRNEYAGADVADAVRICIDIVTVAGSGRPDRTLRMAGRTLAELTAREEEVALLIAEGLSNKAIAERLVISRRTVDGHVERILRKLDAGSRTQVATWVIEQSRRAGSPG
ncbi:MULTISPECIES: ATP-binding protein [Pseudonocardia]|uniref:LuxR family transcriptional regulator n=2 Tax=Pseudonocardia TaxID=1847 RepID=A0ABQ0RV76_9PSEU|nr:MULTISPECIES: LuxR C-terminal-related transcriptional regulator [Pseudonocardia]OSY38345.1 putative HTH-type transcriptional regulator [Pseudonocardia autotrophica]TDN72610.1 putative ATPase [Pseudonocardia autotrophica]BBG03319.1 LuxR family transcriptional regulator [Pseudonocardia autotrophica]GEC24577.1 LuxR family transcriptional regulator [Pseudonocardia saturnea]